MRELLLKGSDYAVVEDRKLVEFGQTGTGKIEAGQIYLGKIQNVSRGLNAAFVSLSKTDTAFLPLDEALEPLSGGSRVLVQVKKPPVQTKGAYLTQDISFASEHLIYLPFSKKCGISQKITDEACRTRLHGVALRLTQNEFGLVIRTSAQTADFDTLKNELDALKAQYALIQEQLAKSPYPALLNTGSEHQSLDRVMIDSGPFDRILSDGVPFDNAVQQPELFSLYDIENQLRKALSRKVWLKSGGFLVIDPCEAMTVIDVNTGKYTGQKSGEQETFRKTNLEAVSEIARLMRLRRLGGIIIVDFIDMQSEENRNAVLNAMTQALMSDPVKCVVHGFTSLGLMEITRKKVNEPLTASILHDINHSEDTP